MIFLYFFIILLIGIIQKKQSSSFEFLYASRKLTLTSFIATIVTTWYGAILDVGRYTYENGILTWVIFCLFYYFSALVYGLFIGPKIHSKNISSLPQFFIDRLNVESSYISSILIYLIGSPIPYIIIFSTIISHVYEINYYYCVLIGVLSSNLYLFIGGFKSVVRTDKFQFILMYLGFIVLLYNLYTSFGGYDFLINNVPKEHLSINLNENLGLLITWFFISFTIFVDPSIFQRSFSAKNSLNVRKGFIYSIIFWIIFDFMTITAGLYASAVIPIEELKSSPFLQLGSMVLPEYLNIIFIISLLAIVMSTIDSTTFISALTLNNLIDLIRSNNKTKFSLSLLCTSIFSIIMCYFFREAIAYWYIFGTITSSGILIPFIFLLFNDEMKIKRPIFTILAPIFLCCYFIIFSTINPIYPGICSSVILCMLNAQKIN